MDSTPISLPPFTPMPVGGRRTARKSSPRGLHTQTGVVGNASLMEVWQKQFHVERDAAVVSRITSLIEESHKDPNRVAHEALVDLAHLLQQFPRYHRVAGLILWTFYHAALGPHPASEAPDVPSRNAMVSHYLDSVLADPRLEDMTTTARRVLLAVCVQRRNVGYLETKVAAMQASLRNSAKMLNNVVDKWKGIQRLQLLVFWNSDVKHRLRQALLLNGWVGGRNDALRRRQCFIAWRDVAHQLRLQREQDQISKDVEAVDKLASNADGLSSRRERLLKQHNVLSNRVAESYQSLMKLTQEMSEANRRLRALQLQDLKDVGQSWRRVTHDIMHMRVGGCRNRIRAMQKQVVNDVTLLCTLAERDRAQTATVSWIENSVDILRRQPLDLLMLRWLNFHMQNHFRDHGNSVTVRVVENFGGDLRDSVVFGRLLHMLRTSLPGARPLVAERAGRRRSATSYGNDVPGIDVRDRANNLIQMLRNMKIPTVLTVDSIVDETADINLAGVAAICCTVSGLVQRQFANPNKLNAWEIDELLCTLSGQEEAMATLDRLEDLASNALGSDPAEILEEFRQDHWRNGLRILDRMERHLSRAEEGRRDREEAWRRLSLHIQQAAWLALAHRAHGRPILIRDKVLTRRMELFSSVQWDRLALMHPGQDFTVSDDTNAKIRDCFQQHHNTLTSIYSHYAGGSEIDAGCHAIAFSPFLVFVSDCGLIHAATGDAIKYDKLTALYAALALPTDRGNSVLFPSGWTTAIAELALLARPAASPLDVAPIVCGFILQVVNQATASQIDAWDEKMRGVDIDKVKQTHRVFVEGLFREFATADQTIRLDAFIQLCQESSLIGLAAGGDVVKLFKSIFHRVQHGQLDNLARADAALTDELAVSVDASFAKKVSDAARASASEMSYEELWAAFAIAACHKFPNPYLPVSLKLERLMASMQQHAPA